MATAYNISSSFIASLCSIYTSALIATSLCSAIVYMSAYAAGELCSTKDES
jgi:hypothetical protein